MRENTLVTITFILIIIPFCTTSAYSYRTCEIAQFLNYNRTLKGNPYREHKVGEDTVNVDYKFMVDLIETEAENFNELTDTYDDPDNPDAGIKIRVPDNHDAGIKFRVPDNWA